MATTTDHKYIKLFVIWLSSLLSLTVYAQDNYGTGVSLETAIPFTGPEFHSEFIMNNYNACNYNSNSIPDVFFKMTSTKKATLSIKTISNYEDAIYILDDNGIELNSVINHTPNDSLLKLSYLFEVGIYYLVFESKGFPLNKKERKLTFQVETLPLLTASANSSEWLDIIEDGNYRRTITPLIETEGGQIRNLQEKSKDTSIEFYNGFGQLSYHIHESAGGNEEDIVHLYEYDAFERQTKSWLPFSFPSGTAQTLTFKEIRNQAPTQYNDPIAYQQILYEDSHLDRFAKQYEAGSDWTGKGVSVSYNVNTSSGFFSCKLYEMNGDNLIVSGIYPPYELFVHKLENANRYNTYEFYDKENRMLLSRQINGIENQDTYYVYDDYGELRYVLPPMASALYISSTSPKSTLDQYAYYYRYDNRGLCVERKLPGAEPEYFYYDNTDRLVLSQNGNQRTAGKWFFHFYDFFGRETITGLCNNTNITELLYNLFITTPTMSGSFMNTGYNMPLTLINPEILTVKYYDNYDFLELYPEYKNHLIYGGAFIYNTRYVNKDSDALSANGLLTGTLTKVLSPYENKKILTALYYDNHHNIIQSKSNNHLGGYDNNYYVYSFNRKTFTHYYVHNSPRGQVTQHYSYVYDHAQRHKSTRLSFNKTSSKWLFTNNYDSKGRLAEVVYNELGGKITYNYDLRNQLVASNSPFYSEELSYDYVGNVTRYRWNVMNAQNSFRQYAYRYDGVDRLLSANYVEDTPTEGHANYYNVTIGDYDKNGNIKRITRRGDASSVSTRIVAPGSHTFDVIDDLTLNYTGNHIKSISNAATVEPYYKGIMNFTDGANKEEEYLYDGNGNMISDANKGIKNITYNYLNLPEQIDVEGTASGGIASNVTHHIYYTYSALGEKLKVQYGTQTEMILSPTGAPSFSRVDYQKYYCGNLIYENDTLSKIILPNGYISMQINRTFDFHYYIKDYLGNIRVVVDTGKKAEQINHYYPFGALLGASTNEGWQKYKFGGKELDRMYGVDWYDFEARLQDPIVGRFLTIDPLCEMAYNISPYAYCKNNPLKFIDPSGMDVYRYDNETGKMSLFRKTNDDFDQIGKFKYNKKTDTYTLQLKKDGTAKTYIDNIEKGILSDGINFKNKNNVIDVNGVKQATVAGVENFLLNFSNMINKEISGYYMSNINCNDISYIYVGMFKNNSDQEAKSGFNLYNTRPDLFGKVDIKVDFHTHLSKFGNSDRLRPSSLGGNGGDIGYKERQLKINPMLRFLIITNPKPFYY